MLLGKSTIMAKPNPFNPQPKDPNKSDPNLNYTPAPKKKEEPLFTPIDPEPEPKEDEGLLGLGITNPYSGPMSKNLPEGSGKTTGGRSGGSNKAKPIQQEADTKIIVQDNLPPKGYAYNPNSGRYEQTPYINQLYYNSNNKSFGTQRVGNNPNYDPRSPKSLTRAELRQEQSAQAQQAIFEDTQAQEEIRTDFVDAALRLQGLQAVGSSEDGGRLYARQGDTQIYRSRAIPVGSNMNALAFESIYRQEPTTSIVSETEYPTISSKAEAKVRAKTDQIKDEQLRNLINFGANIPIGILQFGEGAYSLVTTNPITSAKNVGTNVYDIATNYPRRVEFFNTLRNEPGQVLGQFTGQYLAGAGVGKAAKLGSVVVTDAYVKIAASEVPMQKIISPQVLAGSRFPLTQSIPESVVKFESTRVILPSGESVYEVVTASPGRLSGKSSGAGAKAQAGLEDPGIYVTPKGEASPYFLQLKAQTPEYAFTLNPFKDAFNVPAITSFEVKAIARYPRSVLETPGFRAVEEYQASRLASEGVAVITKRSEIGQGEIARSMYAADTDFVLGTRQIRAGEMLREAGTAELEAVIPKATLFESISPANVIARFKGFEEYTIIENRAVALPRNRVIGANDEFSSAKLLAESQKNYEQAIKRFRSYESMGSQVKYKNPYSFTPSISVSRAGYSSVSRSPFSSANSINYNVSGPYSANSSFTSTIRGSAASFNGSDSSMSIEVSYEYSGLQPEYSSPTLTPGSGSSVPASNSFMPPYRNVKSQKKKDASYDKAYNVLVKDKDKKFVKVNKRPQTYYQAISLGQEAVDNSAARSFILKISGGQPGEPESNYVFNESKLRFSKKNARVFVEKTAYAIDTPGEIRGISAKGWLAQRRKSMGF